jgi:Holliday junction resolvase RusA-like endonuclease
MKFTLSKPPSINHVYAYTAQGGHARSYITKEGKAWFEEASYKLKSQIHIRTSISTPCEIWINLFTAYRQDVDNVLKPILDLLQKNGIVENDDQFFKLDIEKHKCKKEEQRVEVEILGY